MFSTISHQSTGGQILKLGNILYLSPLTGNANSPKRGGIPILFPQFANTGALQKHGFARNQPWQALEMARLDSEISNQKEIAYELAITSNTEPDWPHDAHLSLRFNYQQNQALIIFKVVNCGNSTFTWTGGLHPYFAVDLLNTEVRGLHGVPQQDRYRPQERLQTKPSLTFDARAYESLFDSNQPLNVITSDRSINLSMEGFSEWMIWNPGKEGAKHLKDLPDKDWCRFLCIEPVLVSNPVILRPNDIWMGSLKIQIDYFVQ